MWRNTEVQEGPEYFLWIELIFELNLGKLTIFSLAERMRFLERRSGRKRIFKQKKEGKQKQAAVVWSDLGNCHGVRGKRRDCSVKERTGMDSLGTREMRTWHTSLGLGFLIERKQKLLKGFQHREGKTAFGKITVAAGILCLYIFVIIWLTFLSPSKLY